MSKSSHKHSDQKQARKLERRAYLLGKKRGAAAERQRQRLREERDESGSEPEERPADD